MPSRARGSIAAFKAARRRKGKIKSLFDILVQKIKSQANIWWFGEKFLTLPKNQNKYKMTIEEKRQRRETNRAINSKKTAVTPFMKFARKYKGAFIINSPELKAQLINAD